MVFVEAKAGPPVAGDHDSKFTVQYFDKDGHMTIRSGGTRAWRCNNPGNLRRSPYSMSKKRGAIGFAGYGKDQYPIYPDRATGLEALTVMLKGSVYSPLTLKAALQRYEPGKKDYIDIVADKAGLHPERTIKSLNDKEFKRFWQAIEFVENWGVGKEDFIERWIISGVHKKRGVIFEYCVKKPPTSSWLKKEETIKLANEGRLHVVIVHLKNGTTYLRPKYGARPFQLVT